MVFNVRIRHTNMVAKIVIDVNVVEFIHMNVHPWLVVNLSLIFSLILVHF
jgi:hypothetical protein